MSEEKAKAPPAPSKKNASRYYYWHNHEKQRAAVGDVAPMPTPVLVSTGTDTSAVCANTLPCAVTVKKYIWGDGSRFVSLYISILDTATTSSSASDEEVLVEESVDVAYTKATVKVSFQTTKAGKDQDKRKCKQFTLHLAKRIDPVRCEMKLRPEKKEIHLRLAKAKEETWSDIVGTAEDSDSDEMSENEGEKDE